MTKEIPWERYPTTQHSPTASAWLSIQVSLGLAINTLDAYVRAEDATLLEESLEAKVSAVSSLVLIHCLGSPMRTSGKPF